ncbi:MAG: formylglycine-generating enzyme family protein, partial [Pseudomonadota bacterium]
RDDGERAARRWIDRILKAGTDDLVEKARAVALVSRILADIKTYGGDPEVGTSYASDLQSILALFEDATLNVEERVRIEVGEALGQVGDPRLESPEENRVLIAGGSFWMGADDREGMRNYDADALERERPVHQVTVSAFHVSRYPITVSAYRQFIAAGGYSNPTYWMPAGWSWRERDRIELPAAWETQSSCGNRPVVGVSWFEADAYARFVRGGLPTEAEWEWVTRGEAARRYAWGDDQPDQSRASSNLRFQTAPPVGVYPAGRTEEGVYDLTGTVEEWCADWSGDYAALDGTDPTGPDNGSARVLRGGAFYDHPDYLRAAYRYYNDPDYRDLNVGFRVVWRSPRGQ